MERLRPHWKWNPRCDKEGSGSEWMRTRFSDKILIVESVQRKWPKTKGQILPGALFLPWVKEELLFSKDICKPLDKISACTCKITSEAIGLAPGYRGWTQQGGQEPDQSFCSRVGLALSPLGGTLVSSKWQVWGDTWWWPLSSLSALLGTHRKTAQHLWPGCWVSLSPCSHA